MPVEPRSSRNSSTSRSKRDDRDQKAKTTLSSTRKKDPKEEATEENGDRKRDPDSDVKGRSSKDVLERSSKREQPERDKRSSSRPAKEDDRNRQNDVKGRPSKDLVERSSKREQPERDKRSSSRPTKEDDRKKQNDDYKQRGETQSNYRDKEDKHKSSRDPIDKHRSRDKADEHRSSRDKQKSRDPDEKQRSSRGPDGMHISSRDPDDQRRSSRNPKDKPKSSRDPDNKHRSSRNPDDKHLSSRDPDDKHRSSRDPDDKQRSSRDKDRPSKLEKGDKKSSLREKDEDRRSTREKSSRHDKQESSRSSRETDEFEKPVTAVRRSAIPTPVSARSKVSSDEAKIIPQRPQEENNVKQEKAVEEEPEPEIDVDYDDDFEDYDNDDFEEEESEEDEEEEREDSKLDSGNYERARHNKEMSEVKAAMVRENSARYPTRRHGHAQEPVQDSGHGSNDEQNHEAVVDKRKPSGKGGINFASAKHRQKTKVAAGKARKRGDELLTMIRLDSAKYDLFEMPPIPYEALMGNTDRMQATCQTGEDDLDEELQTEEIKILDKWTQNPPPTLASMKDPDDHDLMMQNLHGVGGQMSDEGMAKVLNHEDMKSMNAVRMSKFLESASHALITLMEEDAERKYGSSTEAQDQKDVVFSDKVTLLDTDIVEVLHKRPVVSMAFSPDQTALLVAAHGPVSSADPNESIVTFDVRSYLTIWNVCSPSQPLHILVTSNGVHSVCFSPAKASMVFAGMSDGAIAVWDLREPYALHQEVVKLDMNDARVHRSPTFTTASSEETFHESPVTGLKPLPPDDTTLEGTYGDTFQLVSCEEQGKIHIWTVLDSVRDSDVHLGLAHWGCVRIVSSAKLDLPSELSSAYDVIFGSKKASDNRGDLFVATGNGTIIHGSTHTDHKPSPRSYKSELDSNIAVRTLAFCPFGEQFILAGADDGSVRMHAVTAERPLITWPGTVDGQPVLQIIWSPSRPCVFYILDSESRIHLWDLGVGDIYPAHTVQFEEKVNVIGINPELGDPRQKQMLALGMENGRVEVHHLKAEYRAADTKACTKELERFLHYVSII